MSQNNKFQKTVVKIGIVLGALSLLAIVVVACDAGGSSGGGSGGGMVGETVGEAIDCTTDANTACSFDVGDTFEGGKGTADDDGDWIGVMLATDTTYRISVEPTDDSATATVAVYSGTATAATPIIGADNLWTPTAERNYYISVVLSAVGEYTLSVAAAPDAGGDACNGTDAEGDCDGDEVLNEDDEFDFDMDKSCTIVAAGVGANRDSADLNCDNDMYANADDTCPALAHADNTDTDEDLMGNPCDPDDDGDLVLDSDDDFPLNACASVDTDDDMAPDEIIDPTAADAGRCSEDELAALIAILVVTESACVDRATCTDTDDDNDGLIEIATAAQLNNVRWDLDGSHYDDDGAGEDTYSTRIANSASESDGSNMGCPETDGCVGYELVADIENLSSTYPNWVSIGFSQTSSSTLGFRGIFEGNGHSIKGLVINTDNLTGGLGLFASVFSDGEIRNLHVAGEINSSSNRGRTIGLLVGFNSGTISNCSANATITGSAEIDRIGGLVGLNDGTLENSWVKGSVRDDDAANDLGGLVGIHGIASIIEIRNSYAVVMVSGSGALGGLVGSIVVGTITNSWAGGMVSGSSADNESVGGLVGRQSLFTMNSVANSYATGAVSGGGGSGDSIGALIGELAMNGGSVSNSYASGTVDGAVGVAIGSIHATGTTETNVVGLTPAQLQGATAAGATISPAVVGTDMLACIAAGGTFTASAGSTPASCAGQATTVYVGWSTDNWHFGSDSQWPALRSFVDNNGDGDNADAGEQGVIICGQPAPRATRTTTECTGALVPLP